MNKVARSLAFTFQSPVPWLSGTNPHLQKHASCPEHCTKWHILSIKNCTATYEVKKKKKKVLGWQIFHAYDIRATAHPPTLTHERERVSKSTRERGEREEGRRFEDGLPDHVTSKEAAMTKHQFQEEAQAEENRYSLVIGVYFHVNRRILRIRAVKHFRPHAQRCSLYS